MEFIEQMEGKISSLVNFDTNAEEMEKPFLDVAQFFLDTEETSEIRGNQAEEEEEEEVSRLTSRAFKTFTPVQLKEAQLLDSSKTFIPISLDHEDTFVASQFESELCDDNGANSLLFLTEEEVGRDFLTLPDASTDFQGDDLLLAGEGDLFVDEANFFNFSHELEERERETPSPASVDTEKEDEGEGEEHIKMEDKARRTISPLQLHAPETPKMEFKDELLPKMPAEVISDKTVGDFFIFFNNLVVLSSLYSNLCIILKEPKSRKRGLVCISGSKAEQKRTKRKRKTPEQLAVLEREFEANPMPNKEVRDQLSARLGLTSRQVQIWLVVPTLLSPLSPTSQPSLQSTPSSQILFFPSS